MYVLSSGESAGSGRRNRTRCMAAMNCCRTASVVVVAGAAAKADQGSNSAAAAGQKKNRFMHRILHGGTGCLLDAPFSGVGPAPA